MRDKNSNDGKNSPFSAGVIVFFVPCNKHTLCTTGMHETCSSEKHKTTKTTTLHYHFLCVFIKCHR